MLNGVGGGTKKKKQKEKGRYRTVDMKSYLHVYVGNINRLFLERYTRKW